MKTATPLKLSLIFLLLQGIAILTVNAGGYTNLVGDPDQNPPPDPDGFGIIHEPDDPAGFDLRQVGGVVTWTHDLSAALRGHRIVAATLRVAVVGLIDQNWGTIDNRLFVNGVELPGAFDNSNDGWKLFEFPLNPAVITNGVLEVELWADPAEGWGGPDYSELIVWTVGPSGRHHQFRCDSDDVRIPFRWHWALRTHRGESDSANDAQCDRPVRCYQNPGHTNRR